MTMSKSGLSMSVGAGGARITSGPRGTHVSFSKAGFYYRTRLDARTHLGKISQSAPVLEVPIEFHVPAEGPHKNPEPASSSEMIGDTTSDDVVRELNDRSKRRNYAIPVGLLISGALLALSVPWPIVAVIGPLAIVLGHLQHRRSRLSALIYGDEEQTLKRLEALHKAVASLCAANSVWSVSDVTDSTALPPHPLALNRAKVVTDARALPDHIRTNITPPALQLADCTLYFFPDRLYIFRSQRFSVVDYTDLRPRFSRITFLERETQPSDAAVEGQMRRSLADTNTIPALYYGMLDFDCGPGLKVRLMTSRVESAQDFVSQMRTLGDRDEPKEAEPVPKELLYTNFDLARVPLFYNLSDQSFEQLQAARNAFALIVDCNFVWQYEEEQRTDDWKRNAGAGTLVKRSRVFPKLVDQIPGFESNAVVGLSIGTTGLYLLPDGYVIRAGDHCRAAGKSMSFCSATTNFREEDVQPADAELIGTTWRYVNKKGGPDLRFNDNRQIPIYRYGQVDINCGSMRFHLCLSRANAAQQFETAIRAALSRDQGSTREQSTEIPPRKNTKAPIDLVAAFRLLGLEPTASLEQASAAYKNLAAQNHPDKVAHMAQEFRDLAERKMRELNAAYEIIRNSRH
jgi:hypothetical protein